tara:strand:+ start:252 stop:428 length:177 start_codon:yes stop_codon:yes gene_type:complete
MDIGNVEANTILLKKTIKYLPDGTEKEQIEKQIKTNYKLIDDFFDQLAEEAQYSSYEH